ncbi:MAG: M23 family metallopeptidase, partial [Candidatus Hydrogenedentes bacterium]|nr:M23 family metallopeptidase [Candidatus Hydrogenedentota bacterium]
MTIGIVLAALALGAAEPYDWPLDLPRALTSSFAEYRPGRFHAGIDLRTGPVGKAVHAPADGHVSRIRCSPWGYGKAVYVQLADGNTVVFGHLQGFSAPLEAYVRAHQHRLRSYTVDLYPEAGAFPVRRGEVIARSG